MHLHWNRHGELRHCPTHGTDHTLHFIDHFGHSLKERHYTKIYKHNICVSGLPLFQTEHSVSETISIFILRWTDGRHLLNFSPEDGRNSEHCVQFRISDNEQHPKTQQSWDTPLSDSLQLNITIIIIITFGALFIILNKKVAWIIHYTFKMKIWNVTNDSHYEIAQYLHDENTWCVQTVETDKYSFLVMKYRIDKVIYI